MRLARLNSDHDERDIHKVAELNECKAIDQPSCVKASEKWEGTLDTSEKTNCVNKRHDHRISTTFPEIC